MTSISATQFNTQSLRISAWGDQVCRILCAALQAVDPVELVMENIHLNGAHLQIGTAVYNLEQIVRVILISIGKASIPMAAAAGELLGIRLAEGVAITKRGHTQYHDLPSNIRLVEAGHPIPDENSILAGELTSNLLAGTNEKDLVVCLISGGGSSLCVRPAPGITLEDIQGINQALLACGANIAETNTVRKHLETIKGGGLSNLAAPAQVASLILSDVIGDAIDQIASGLTVPDPTTYQDALQVLEKYDLRYGDYPRIIAQLNQGAAGERPETKKPGDPIFEKVNNYLLGNNRLAAEAAVNAARHEGLNPLLLTTSLQGEARQAGRFLASLARQVAIAGEPIPRPACLVAGGETTVRITGKGMGGRNQEVALGAVVDLAGLSETVLIALATDGGDGPTDAAGAVVTGDTFSKAIEAGMKPLDYLDRNDSYHFFEALGDLIKTGPTLTNVNDLSLVFAF